MSHVPLIQLAARIGLDWADDHHDFALRAEGSTTVETDTLGHTPEAIATWVTELRRRFGGRPVGICLEQARGPLIHALLEYDFLVLYPITPRTLKRFREAFRSSGAKDDVTDAELLLELLEKHRDRLRAWQPDDVETRALARLAAARRKAVDLRTALTQQLRAELKGYFPQAIDLVGGHLTTSLACAFLLRWPRLDALQRAQPQTVRAFYYGHRCRRGDLIEQRLKQIAAARPLTTDAAIVESSVLTVQMLARQIQALNPSIARYEQEIARRFERHPDVDLFRALPGGGPALGPRLLVAFGTDRERFASALELQQLSGIAPVTEQSGKSCHVHWRWAAPAFLRQTFHEFAGRSLQRSSWARAFYELQRERGKDHHAAVRSLAFKWIRFLWRCWQDRTAYNEARYIEALRTRGSPLVWRLEHAAAA